MLATLAHGGILGWLTSKSQDWTFIQETGGIRVGAPIEKDGKQVLPVDYWPNGNSGLAVRRINLTRKETPNGDDQIIIQVVTQLVEKGADTAKIHYVDLTGIPPGRYEVYYEGKPEYERLLAQIDTKSDTARTQKTSANGSFEELEEDIGGATENKKMLTRLEAVGFSDVKSASVARIIAPEKHHLAKQGAGAFHGYNVISNWQSVNDPSRFEVADLLKKRIDSLVNAYANAGDNGVFEPESFCIPDPGYAVHLETDKGPRDFAICLECEQVDAFGDQGKSVNFGVDAGQTATLKRNYYAEFAPKSAR
jgi:hypothetical protein